MGATKLQDTQRRLESLPTKPDASWRDSITATHEVLTDRWDAILRDVRWHRDDAGYRVLETVNSKRYRRVDDVVHELGALLVEELVDRSEVDSFDEVNEGIWTEIKDRLLSWALEVHMGREAYRREHLAPSLVSD